MKLKALLKDLGISKEDSVYIHQYGKDDFTKEPIGVADISAAMLKKEVLVVQPNHGGQKYGYKHLMFVVR